MSRKHKVIFGILKPLVRVYTRVAFGFKYEKVDRKDLPENYIVLANHTTDYDPILLSIALPGHMYFVASEHIARFKAFKPLKWAFDPIIRYKGTVASKTVMNVLRRLRKGDNVAVMAEGVRTFDGVTCPILPSTAKLVKAARCGLVTYKFTGGYFVSPAWSNSGNTRKGEFYGAVQSVYTKEQLSKMSESEISELINRDLYEDAYERQLAQPKPYKGKRLSDGLETLFFVCPKCGARASFESKGESIACKACGLEIVYDEYGMLSGTEHKTVRDFSRWQDETVAQDVEGGVTYEAESAELYVIETTHEATLKAKGALALTAEKLVCGDTEIDLKKIYDMGTCGRYKLMFSADNVNYELKLTENSNIIRFCKYFKACKAREELDAVNEKQGG